MIILTKKNDFLSVARILFIFAFIFFLPLAFVTGENNTVLPIDSLSSGEFSHTSFMSSGEEILSLHTVFSKIYQNEIIIGKPVTMYQLITLTNTENKTISGNFSLEDYPKEILPAYLHDAVHISISSAGKEISNTTQVSLTLSSREVKELYVDYTFVPVYQTLHCQKITLANLLPSQAVVTSTTIGLGAEISKVCTLTLSHNSSIHYYDVRINLDDFDITKITSVYYVQGDQYLQLDGNQINIPRPEP